MKSEPFITKDGIRQGVGMSHLLFNIFMEKMQSSSDNFIRRIQKFTKNKNIRVWFCRWSKIHNKKWKNLQINIYVWKKKYWNMDVGFEKKNEEKGMKLNLNKTKVMDISEHLALYH